MVNLRAQGTVTPPSRCADIFSIALHHAARCMATDSCATNAQQTAVTEQASCRLAAMMHRSRRRRETRLWFRQRLQGGNSD